MGSKAKNLIAEKVGAALVVGGGIGGIQASLDLAESGIKVYLVDKSPAIGGVMSQLDKTFPTGDCAMCIMAPKLVECGRHLNIEVLTNVELKEIKGGAGNFEVSIVMKPRYIDIARCTGCGLCSRECPINAIDAYNEGLSARSAIYIRYPQAIPLAYAIDREKCIGCGLCETVCMAKAINFEDRENVNHLKVGAIILTPGFDEFDAHLKGEYGYGRYPNVVTSIEYERVMSASGPFEGHIMRRSDGKVPQKIAFVQCVGSRDSKSERGYCSSVCCMYATKEAVISKEHDSSVEIKVFGMDVRSYGKEFDRYVERAKGEYGVEYIRSRVSSLEEVPDTRNLRITYETEDGDLRVEEFELVVLSVGLDPLRGGRELGRTTGIELDDYGFCRTGEFSPVETSSSGIYVGGAFQGPKDIPETVTQASASASKASGLLSSVRGSLVKGKEYPPEGDVRGQEPRIGAFICHCGINIGAYVDVPEVVEYVKRLPNVVYAEENLYTCSQDAQQRIKEMIEEHDLNRVVVASCTPRTHEPLFQETIREAGLNRHLFEMANIRDQCSWVHMHEPDLATEKAKDLVGMAVAKARLIEPLEKLSVGVIDKGLVIGGGLAGMTAALGLAEQGFEVFLIEKEGELGGNLRRLYYSLEGNDIQEQLGSIIERVETNELIQVYTNRKIKGIEGFVGNFKTTLASNGGEEVVLEHGVIIVAIGAEEYEPTEYLYGEDERVVTQQELEERIANNDHRVAKCNDIVMIQCVGSRSDERPYCSRVCCSEAVKNALKLKELNPSANIYILYKDVRTYGLRERYYTKAREEGVIFIRYDDENKPEASLEDGVIKVSVMDPILGEHLVLNPDLLVLSTAIVPHENDELAKMLKVPLTEDGFFLEAHVKLRPIDFSTDGIFLCGLAHSPKLIDESIAQADGAVARAATALSKGYVTIEPIVSSVDEEICTGCGTCVELCPYGAMEKDEQGIARVTEVLCKGCGTCGASCPEKAITMHHFTDEQLIVQATTALRELGDMSR